MQPYLIVTGDFVRTGGMDRANWALARHLAQRGTEVHLVAFRVDPQLLQLPNIIHHRVPKPAGSYTLALPLLARAGRYWAKRIARQGGRVIVNGGSAPWHDINWVHYLHAAHTPVVGHGAVRRAVTRINHRRWLRDERCALQGAQIVIANSQRTRQDLIERVGVDPLRIQFVSNGVDRDDFRPASDPQRAQLRDRLGWRIDRRIVLFVGAMSDRRKGFDVLFDAWAQLCREPQWDADLAVIGAGGEVAAWQARARAEGLGARIHFMGHRSDMPDLLRAADLLVAPARYEPYGLAVHEALCCGVPALVSAHAGVAERFGAELRELLLEHPEDASYLVEHLRHWRASERRLRDAVHPLSEQLRSRSWDDMASDIVNLIEGSTAELNPRRGEGWVRGPAPQTSDSGSPGFSPHPTSPLRGEENQAGAIP